MLCTYKLTENLRSIKWGSGGGQISTSFQSLCYEKLTSLILERIIWMYTHLILAGCGCIVIVCVLLCWWTGCCSQSGNNSECFLHQFPLKMKKAAFSNYKCLHACSNVTAANIVGHLRSKTEKCSYKQRKLSRGNRNTFF